ncbi:iron transporter [Dactylonectria macrodidyma]|uniref:Solute carrier family 40 member n=1 Tax=Dactylonectria macrodidyma TaxID=307937 RepID=A0A9P9DUD7_9HYPO|nr:iron transporter [Dactylonectria macrodidyma]
MQHPSRPHVDTEAAQLDERTALLSAESTSSDSVACTHRVNPRIASRLYLSHFLSSWNSRVFEFGAVLYLATIFPGTLLPMSVYALTRGLSAVLFAPAIGHYIDTNDRLQVVRASIVFQRLAVATSCAIFYILYIGIPLGQDGRMGMLAVVSFLACVEKLYSIVNLVSVEKDWVVVLAENDTTALSTLNAQMRRIDLLCKLLGPLCIALVDGFSTEAAIITNFSMNVASVVVEYFAIAWIYYEVPTLQENRTRPGVEQSDVSSTPRLTDILSTLCLKTRRTLCRFFADFGFYFQHRAFLPSIAGALLYLTVLSFSGQMITYLVSSGYTTIQIAIARTLSVAFEVLATWVAPWLIGRIGPVRAGLWMSNCQVIPLIAGITVFGLFTGNSIISASGLVVGTIVSRVGLRGFDLCMQVIVQEEVEAESRGSFSSVEAAWQNAFELLSYFSTIVFFRPSQFFWPSMISCTAVTTASFAYTFYVYLRRGHLLHLEKITNLLWKEAGSNGYGQ